MFGRPKHGITPSTLSKVLRRHGICLKHEELMDFFSRYDVDGSGGLDFGEFSSGIMEKDYPRKPWTMIRGETMEKASKAKRWNVSIDVVDTHNHLVDQRKRERKMKKLRERQAQEQKYLDLRNQLQALDASTRRTQKRPHTRGARTRSRGKSRERMRPSTASPSKSKLQSALHFAASSQGPLNSSVRNLVPMSREARRARAGQTQNRGHSRSRARLRSMNSLGRLNLRTKFRDTRDDVCISHASAWK